MNEKFQIGHDLCDLRRVANGSLDRSFVYPWFGCCTYFMVIVSKVVNGTTNFPGNQERTELENFGI